MTTEELIKKLKENKRVDVVVITALDGVKKLVILNDMSNPLFRLPTTATNWLELESVHSQLIADSLGKESRECVAEQISEYLDTPLDKRKPEKKYTVRTIADNNDSYLVCTAEGNYFFGCLNMHDAYGDQVSFTKDEIEEMKLDDYLAIDWDKATIEEDK